MLSRRDFLAASALPADEPKPKKLVLMAGTPSHGPGAHEFNAGVKLRIVAEHGIGKRKIWRIVADRFRNPRRTHTVIMKNVAGLHSLMFS